MRERRGRPWRFDREQAAAFLSEAAAGEESDMAKRRHSNRRRRRGSSGFLYKLLSVLVICGCLVAAMTLFFRVDSIVVTGQTRYTEEEIREASGIRPGDNLILLNKYDARQRILDALPYIETIGIRRRPPDTLTIEVQECGVPVALVQEGSTWFISPKGMIVEQRAGSAAEGRPVISGCELLAPSVGTEIALATEFSTQQESLLSLLTALDEAGMLEDTSEIRMDDLSVIRMDYIDRFTVKLPYSADYGTKLRILRMAIDSEYVQDNMTGTFDLTRDDGRTYLDQSVR